MHQEFNTTSGPNMVAEKWVGSGEQSGVRIHVTEDSQIERGWRNVVWPAGTLRGSGKRNGMRIYDWKVSERDKN